jgi:hypothetical protein
MTNILISSTGGNVYTASRSPTSSITEIKFVPYRNSLENSLLSLAGRPEAVSKQGELCFQFSGVYGVDEDLLPING